MNPLVIGGLFEVGKSLIDRFFPDPQKKAEAELKLLEMQQNGELAALAADTELAKAQILTNTEEAKSTSLFIAGWRPHVGWVCGFAFSYHFLLQPFLLFLLYTFGTPETIAKVAELPTLDWSAMSTVLMGMLGLGGFRTYEKIKGSERNR